MTAPHQDKRIEAALTVGAGKLVDAAIDAVGDHVLGTEVGPILHALRTEIVEAVRGPLLELLAVFVDTSAHVKAPHVDVHVHRPAPPHDVEDA